MAVAPPIPAQIGRYDILELVGRGGMGVLYRARDPVLEREVALKMMLVDFSHDPAARERFEREAKAVARLQHRNVVTIHELGEADGAPYIVMEFLSGQDLERRMRGPDPLTLFERLDIVAQLCEGLGYAHEQGIVHRDIKPGNVRVLEDGTVKILDFGIAKFAMSSMTQSGTVMGTAHYMAPEQIMGGAIDGRADLFSAGVLLHELLSGQKPFAGDSPTAVAYQIMQVEPPSVASLVPELPAEVAQIVARALQKNPEDRYSRASEMASDLQVVKMMADVPLSPVAGAPDATSTGRLFATGVTNKTLATARRQSGTTSSAAPPAASATPAKALIAGMAAAGVLVVGLAWFLLRSGPAAATPPSTDQRAADTRAAVSAAAASGPETNATVMVASVPSGARVIVGGVDTGRVTPTAVPAGSTVELALKGYLPFSTILTPGDATAGTRDVRLSREAGPVRLTVSAVFPFTVAQGGKVLSADAERHQVTVQPGGGPLTVRNADLVLSQTIPIDFGRSQMDVTLPAPGTLAVFARDETCSVVANGVELGFPPIARKTVAAGALSVALTCPNGKGETQRVTITPGQTVRVTFSTPQGN